jgi:hypothetical protein
VDVARSAYGTDPPEVTAIRAGERVATEIVVNTNSDHQPLPDGQTTWCRTLVPECAGSWMGDRIIVAGAYASTSAYVSDDEVKQFLATLRNVPHVSYVSLFDYAHRFYKNISRTVKQQLSMFDLGNTSRRTMQERYEDFLKEALLGAFDPYNPVGRGHKKRRKYNLTWMTYKQILGLLDRWRNESDINEVKAWMRAQTLSPWQREVLKHIKVRNGRMKVDNPDGLEKTLDTLKVPRMQNTLDWGYVPLLPSKHYLYAAMEVQMQQEGLEFQ